MFKKRAKATEDPWVAYERLALRDATALSADERRLVALGGLRTEVNNGGFHQYFFNSAGDFAQDAIDAAAESGAPALADLVRRALDVVGLDTSADRDVRQAALEDIDPEQFDDLDEEFLSLESSSDLDAVMRSAGVEAP